MPKKHKVLIFVLLALVFALAILSQISFETVSKPMDFCTAPYDWGACQDWTFNGLRASWGKEGFVAFLNVEDWHMIWNGTAYDRQVSKMLLTQSSFFGDTSVGNCGGWGGICYQYSDQVDIFTPQ